MAVQRWLGSSRPLFFSLNVFAVAAAPYTAHFSSIATSGTWNAPFAPARTDYEITLEPGRDSVMLDLQVDLSPFTDPTGFPRVSIDGEEVHYGQPGLITKRVRLGDTGPAAEAARLVNVTLSSPEGQLLAAYRLNFVSPPDLQQALRITALIVEDAAGRPLALAPAFQPAAPRGVYAATLGPGAAQATVNVSCASGAAPFLTFGALHRAGAAGAVLSVPVSLETSRQSTVRVGCSSQGHSHSADIRLQETVDLQSVNLRIVPVGGGATVAQPAPELFVLTCGGPDVEFVPLYDDPRLHMVLRLPDGSNVTSGAGVRSPRLVAPAVGDVEKLTLTMSADSGETRQWHVVLQRLPGPSSEEQRLRRGIAATQAYVYGAMVAALAGSCMISTGLVCGLGSWSGAGVPMGSAGALRGLVLLLQFVSLGNIVRSSSTPLTDFAAALRWLTLLPAPAPAADGLPSEVSWAQAAVCLQRATGLLAAVAAVHIAALVWRYVCSGPRHTLPHGLALGTWEVQCLPYVACPVAFAAAVLLCGGAPQLEDLAEARGGVPVRWRVYGLLALLGVALLVVVSCCSLASALSGGLVTWINRDAGEMGHFCDTVCDQLSSRPTDRCLCAGAVLNFRWAATIADIRDVAVADLLPPEGLESERDEEKRAAALELDPGSPLSKSVASRREAIVEVLATPHPHFSAGGLYSRAGFFAEVPWLQAALSSEALLRLHHEVGPHLHDVATPLRVEVDQLQGPLTCGRLGFCFDGLRWPPLAPLELLFHAALGALAGVSAAMPASRAAALAVAAAVAAAMFATVLLHAPFTCLAENASSMLAHLALLGVALAYLGYVGGVVDPDVCGGLVLICVTGAGIPLSCFAGLRALATVCAATCPMGAVNEEADVASQCNVDLTLRGPQDSWLLTVPAHCGVPVADAFVHAMPDSSGMHAKTFVTDQFVEGARPRLEFPVLDYLAVTDKLEPPLVILSGPGHEHGAIHNAESIYADEDPKAIATDFVRRCVGGGGSGSDVLCTVLEVMRSRAAPGCIFSLALVVLPIDERHRREDGGASSEDEEASLIPSLRSGPQRYNGEDV